MPSVTRTIVLKFRTFVQASRYDDAGSSFKFERCEGRPLIPIHQITAAVSRFTSPYQFPPVNLPAFVILDTSAVSGIEPEVTIRTQHCSVECAIGQAKLTVSGEETAVDWFIEVLSAVGRQVGIGRGRRYGWGRFDVEVRVEH